MPFNTKRYINKPHDEVSASSPQSIIPIFSYEFKSKALPFSYLKK